MLALQCKIWYSEYGDLCCLLGGLETKEQSGFSGFGLERSEIGVVEGNTDVEMLECIGAVETDGEIQRCDGKAGTGCNETRDNSGWISSCCTRC
jgi:hypothetical protein